MKLIDKTAVANALNHWYQLSPRQQMALLCALGALLLYLPAQHYWQQRSQLEHLMTQQQTQQATLSHQQKILTVLKEKAAKQLLTPQLAGKLPPINQQIQQLAQQLHIEHSQWDFRQKPLLTLHLEGHFNDLRQFLTALLNANDELELVEWQIQKLSGQNNGNTISSELLLQLNTKEN
ncbi:competence protein [Aggregatibacter aphrophilus]|jgi:competence protein C|uniref:Competence protein n=1 Tax=Aggregatibacter aphrophilus TaxID=732 RepID=A0AAP7GZP3_AGGAP|nr:competence protein [Aggregatibacter aphrophilus]OBY54261.1 competence protein [Aggregatibacter aphrophilus]